MRKNKVFKFMTCCLAILIIAAMLVSGCSSAAPGATAPAAPTASAPQAAAPSSGAAPVEIKAITFVQTNDQRAVLYKELCELIEKKSNGGIVVKFLGGPEVIPAKQLADNLKAGNINLAMTPGSYMESLVPGLSVLGASQLSSEEERQVGLWDKLNEMCEPGGLRFIGRFMPQNSPTVFLGVRGKEIKTIEDFKGLKMGYSSPALKQFAESVGMAIVTVPLPEAYTALEKGTVNILADPINDHKTYKFYEIEDYIVDHPFLISAGAIVMNLPMWNKLSPEMQKAVTDAYLEWEPHSIQVQLETENKIKDELKGKVNFVKLQGDDGAKLVQMAYDAEWVRFPKDNPVLAEQLKALMTKK